LEFEEFFLGFILPQTEGKSKERQKLLDYLKTFISNIDAMRDCDITLRKRDAQLV